MPYFTVSNGMKTDQYFYQVHFNSIVVKKEGKATILHSDRTEFWPQPKEIYEIPEYVAKLPLDLLISIYNREERRVQVSDQITHENPSGDYEEYLSQWNLRRNIATVKLKRIEYATAT